jgi:DNA-binding NarL/FixJ family response regulator
MLDQNVREMLESAKIVSNVGEIVDRWGAGGPGAEHVLTDVGPGANLRVPEKGSARPRLAATVLIVDDCMLYRENLAVALSANGASSTYSAWDMASLLSAFEACTPDVVLLSMSTKNSAALLHAMIEAHPGVKVIAVGVWEGDESTIVASAEAGVTGYHLRDESFADLLQLIREVADGESVCSPKVAAVLLRRLSALASARKPDLGELVLTAREIEILALLEVGLSNREIANQLCIALHTVKNHVHSVLGKLGVSTRAQAAAASRSIRHDEMGMRA